MSTSAATEALELTGHQGQWLRDDARLDSSRGGPASVAVAGLAYDGIVVVASSPGNEGQLTNFASDGRAACTFATVGKEIVLGPAVPLDALVASLSLDIGGVEDGDDDQGAVLDEGTLAALNALFGRGEPQLTATEAASRLKATIAGTAPGRLLQILADEALVELAGEHVRPGSLTHDTPALAAYVSGHRFDVYRVHLASGASHRRRRALFCGPLGERFALLKGPDAGMVTIARMSAVQLSLALATVVGGTDGPEAPLVARPLDGRRDVPAGGPWTIAALTDLERVPDDVADVVDRPAWTATITIDATDGRRTLGVSGAEGIAIRWDATDDGLVLTALELVDAPPGVAADVLPDDVTPGAQRAAASPEAVLRDLPHGRAADRRRALIAVSVRRGHEIDTSSCLVIDRGSQGAWLVELDDDAPEPLWTPCPATRDALATWLRKRLL